MYYRAGINQAKCLNTNLWKQLFADQRFPWSNGGEARIETYALQTKAVKQVGVAVKGKNSLNAANMTLGLSISASTNHCY